MLLVLGCPYAYAKFVSNDLGTPFHCFHPPNTIYSQLCSPKLRLRCTPFQRHSFKSFCKREEEEEEITPFSQGFSALQEEDSPWESGNVWSNLALYLFTLHIPFSFGGLSVVALFNGQPVIDPQTEALSLLTIQILELSGTLVLLKYTAKPQYKFTNFFKKNNSWSYRNWFLSSALGFGFLALLIFLTSLLADYLYGSKPVSNPIQKEMLLSSGISRVSCVLAYCIVIPLLEEVVYRGFLLTSLSSTMEWPQAVAISSVIFSAIHLSGENFLQLFIIGCLLGCSYSWTGNLYSSIVIHSLYNAFTLVVSYFY
ncbi:uncharacterized protein LOC124843449 [Vigna umbellata]|uniref:CAAX prenyl protease 2/Lysostaphin resistance protein A-like domain-containing protein n=2 Tax=Phaseolus angularis TaxID=3914 RepID=A0A0L9V6C8_PHAAN|nr:uncharacterized protein LOC108339899 isoform X1 [Vigna angularis]XP_047176154.1 uncharacterized protein LOC124843449 [Vigna umbellata]KOM50244.1 hypothetical protein LR48_Vigan08g107100 [Vigna angularis]BAT90151.1 hypothetical protein VIGAN_06133700 [Vigna angularis var. angularis]